MAISKADLNKLKDQIVTSLKDELKMTIKDEIVTSLKDELKLTIRRMHHMSHLSNCIPVN